MVKGDKLVRLTFSEPLAQFLLKYDPEFRVQRFKIRRSWKLEPGEKSSTGIYLLCTSKCGSPLRASLSSGIAEIHHDEHSRWLYEGELKMV